MHAERENDMPKNEIVRLEKILDEADVMYHTFGASELSDDEYDAYVDKLREIDPSNKRFKDKKVGAKEDVSSGWEKCLHDDYPMGSQSKVNDFDSLKRWADKHGPPFYVQEKLDGISIKMTYENGLSSAVTRGDGKEGENITKNVLKMTGIPTKINDDRKLVIRGEILLYHSNLEYIGGKTARNSAAGTAKRLDGKGCEYLNVQVYDIMNWKDLGLNHHGEGIKLLKELGFTTVNTKLCKTIHDVESIMKRYNDSIRESLDWDIDGLVVKCAILKNDDWKYPNRSIAYKFPNQVKATKLIDVVWRDTGGRISPIGILEPVEIGGVTIGKATLNNIDHISRLNIKIGDTVLVSRRNDVIPCIEKVVIEDPDGKIIKSPTHDEDGFEIVREKNSEGKELAYLVSTNPNSKSKIQRTILSWFTNHNCKGIAGATIDAIMSAGIAKDLPSFYDMCINGDIRLLDLEGFGKSTFKMLHQNALKTSKTTLIPFLLGCDVSGFGEKRFEAILENFNKDTDLNTFIDLVQDINAVGNIPGLGINTAKALKNAINNKKSLLLEMNQRVEVASWKPGKVNTNSKINGMTFCFTGKMDTPRGDLERMVKSEGGIVAGVSKKLDYLVTNDPNSGSGKNKKADQLGISKITEDQFLNLLES